MAKSSGLTAFNAVLPVEDPDAVLMAMASRRPSLLELYYPSLESEVVGPYMKSRRRHYSDREWAHLVLGMHTSTTIYVGNLSFYTREEQVHELFSRVAPVKRVIMGLNANTRTPCGFCFVEYHTHEAAKRATDVLNGLKLDDRVMRADLDAAFEEGRQYGRGQGGGQIMDDRRADFDIGRGGWGTHAQQRKERAEAAKRMREAQADTFGGAVDHDRTPQPDEHQPQYDPETYGGGYERPSTSSIFNVDRPLKLSQATIAALTPGVFPHYDLPLPVAVQKAFQLHLEATNPAAAAIAAAVATADTHSAAFTANGTSHAKRSHSPLLTAVADAVPMESESPATKRARHASPPPIVTSWPNQGAAPAASIAAAVSASSPQPRSPQPRSPQPRSPQPRSPQPFNGAAAASYVDDGDVRTPPPDDNDIDDSDRTPQHLDDADGDRTPQDLSPTPLDADDRTPPPPADGDEVDADATPKHIEDDMRDDDATPPPPPDGNQPNWNEFER